MRQYLDLLAQVVQHGAVREDRTGVGTRSLFGYQMRFDLNVGFPLLTTKKCHLKSIIYELLWFLRGDTNLCYLRQNGVSIWDEWATEEGDLGPIYGEQWRSWPGQGKEVVDQIQWVIDEITTHPHSRRLVVSAWNPSVLPDSSLSAQENVKAGRQALPPCHCLFQFYVQDGTLSCQLYQRSADVFLGVPFNIASYSLLTLMLAQVCRLKPGFFVHSFGDVHLYNNHIEQARMQLQREPLPLPTMRLNTEVKSVFDFICEDFQLLNYRSHPPIKADIAV